ncbi:MULTISPECIES: hypothetical protein [Mesorhizobium]|uniref:Uncharacterized protein n=1 Tax=Mesorhizobium japonicum R7A TaxID=935547 RepID=A0ABX6MKW4_9HYPH|nr:MULTISPECIES: hypothetical protein [Mesorhizobium]MBE1707942.1 hypothetical protein [Mesorhizobium japonicum]MBE1713066.1 hypothetical protein [Mesorhizobium japonicum]MUT21305.1 hypothetical protein [Mesorhizobium japonicum]MUT26528.1 hypothetical protein [Mesorhizobium japonicum]QJE99602.1 hypothetical protein R7A2020_01005 [Mesorhizobium japonicum R7A]
MAEKSAFTDKEVEEYLKRRKRPTFHEGIQKLECLHCGNPYSPHEGGGGLCEICFDRD